MIKKIIVEFCNFTNLIFNDYFTTKDFFNFLFIPFFTIFLFSFLKILINFGCRRKKYK